MNNRDGSHNRLSGNGSSGDDMPPELSRPVPISPSKVKALTAHQLGFGNDYRAFNSSNAPAENFQEVGENDYAYQASQHN